MKINFEKGDDLVPAIVQDDDTQKVLMLGYLNQAAYEKTVSEKKVTFFSRSKNRLWTKGETSGNYLLLKRIILDCDSDTLLIKAIPAGSTCHTGRDTCFGETNSVEGNFLRTLEKVIQNRKLNPTPDSYTAKLFQKGVKEIAQKVGEEATELVIEAVDADLEKFKNEAADLVYHFLVLLAEKNLNLKDIEEVLEGRR